MKKTKARNAEAAERAGNKIGDWWIGNGCVPHSDRLKEYATATIRRAISAAVRAERTRCGLIVERHGQRAFVPGVVKHAACVCDDIMKEIAPARAAKKGKR